ncbi:MAG: type I-E CRISPR-associated protein Cas5/CasD [Rothia sp. (in: high G+C Gram-positive bacteria)]|uniref:type I-E CRISPR-associated protein Cas5/CasD n=1 Tax=Rothia sp. (in: high G+C Gram-positive bacteria) TaxID=1885016 RepID=UPI0026DED20A|nr:type I-E CRISPR-associated protein Cas5/CasD [Rothia sp. (in: high G+C Gram-positive bacteria)]MDO5750835.1 type I-E CRISPR-associated protein Cas5/CasD [Rothia sp. (in: high G+C Gram-positive bacteria)]
MPTLLLKLSGPLQSWGTQSRYRRRETDSMPSKSGVIGLLAAALGRARTESVDDLSSLGFAVRIDAPGQMVRDYQTAKDWARKPNDDAKLSTRYYLSDAVFLVALESDDRAFLERLESALRAPVYPLYLGRRSCPAGYDMVPGKESAIREYSAVDALRHEPWNVAERIRQQSPNPVQLPIVRESASGEDGLLVNDVPVSFSPEHRQYLSRKVLTDSVPVTVENPDSQVRSFDTVDFMSFVQEA